MPEDQNPVVKRVLQRVRDGAIPQTLCANCSVTGAQRHELYAVCTQVHRRWKREKLPSGFAAVAAMQIVLYAMTRILLIPVPSFPRAEVEVREGEDLVVPVPIHLCDACWNRLNGGKLLMILSGLSKFMCFAGVATVLLWLVAESKGNRTSIYWIFGCFTLALPFYVGAEAIKSCWPKRLKNYLRKIEVYKDLLDAYPETVVVQTKPSYMTEPKL